MKIPIETFTEDLAEICPEVDAVHDGSDVGFYRFNDGGKYDGIVYTYADIKIHDEDPPRLEFTYFIMDDQLKNQPDASDDAAMDEFYQTIGDILVRIINHFYGE